MPQEISVIITGLGLSLSLVLAIRLALYLVFGCFMDTLSMILLTIPIFFPIIIGLDFGLSQEETVIWFGILVLVVVEVRLITPPVGMNLFSHYSLSIAHRPVPRHHPPPTALSYLSSRRTCCA